MNFSSINPYVRVAMHSVLRPHHTIKQRVIYDYELIYIERGHLLLKYDSTDYTCKEGDVLLLCPGVPHSFHLSDEEVSQPHIHFDLTYHSISEKIPVSFKDTDAMTKDEKTWIAPNEFKSYPTQPFVRFRDTDEFHRLFYTVISANDSYDRLMQKGFLTQLIAMMIADNFPDFFKKQTPYPIARQIKDYIDAGQAFQMKLEDFEKQFSYSKFYLEKMFKSTYGMSLIEYRNRKRMKLAEMLLRTLPVSRVAEQLGYQSIYAFSRAYKLHYGASPTKSKSQSDLQ